jgi:hypothetical protein
MTSSVSVIRKYALAALCGAAIVGVGQSAQAATWDINGGVAPVSTASYGTAPNDNNVINNPAATGGRVFDTLAGASVIAAANLQATFTAGNNYTVSWVYLGSESDNTIRFFAPGGTVPVLGFPEDNRNNQCATCNFPSAQLGQQTMGVTANQTALTPAFSFVDFNDGSNVANGANNGDNETPPAPNFLMSYAVQLAAGDPGATFGTGLYLTAAVTNIVVIGLNDTGFADDNHDDFMLAAFISETQGPTTPIPGALPLFASVLGGGFLFRRLRNRRQAKAAA